MRNLLLIDDDEPVLRSLLAEQLEDWRIASGEDAPAPRELAAAILTGGKDRAAKAARLRAGGMVGPIFSLDDDTPQAPLAGLSRPFRIWALVQRLKTPDLSWIDGAIIGKWRLDATQRSLVALDSNHVERLTDKELALLQLILVTLPAAVDRETLQTEIWRYHAEADTHTVETHVWRLRQKLEDDPGSPQWLVTVAGGYTLVRR